MTALHPQTRAMVDAMARMNPVPPDKLTVEQAREQFRRTRAPFLAPAQEVGAVIDAAIPGPGGRLRIRTYRPLGSRHDELLPAMVYFHGGGWVFGDLDSHDPMCRELCNLAGCAVVAIDYRLAPENRFPAAVEDAIAAIRHVAEHGADLGLDATRLAAGGDSAGGNLTAVAALAFRDEGGPRLRLQVLVYPVTDFSMDAPSYARIANGFTLTRDRMRYFRESYLRGPEDIDDWRASPLKVRDASNLPPALIIAADHDPLVDEGKAYADRLAAADVRVTYTCYEGVVHGFASMAGAIDAGHTAIAQAAAALKSAFSSAR
ncbi:MAG TPA: alpha/beta hydrolase [Burkholderiales bacterium]|nr:alpha/beta hydrolase [Burkholderiales bacterium]